MKKLVCAFMAIFLITGCGIMNNTPTKKVEDFLAKYQNNDKDVVSDLNDVLTSDVTLTDDERNDYNEFMKKHYQDMTYKIKDERIDGDTATVEVEVTVRNYADSVNEANNYRLSNASEFDEENTFSSYRLKEMKKVTDTETYTITFHLTKSNDQWTIDPLTSDDESKLNGLYGVTSVNRNITSDSINDQNKTNSTSENNNDTGLIDDITDNKEEE